MRQLIEKSERKSVAIIRVHAVAARNTSTAVSIVKVFTLINMPAITVDLNRK